jgi:hypothetical protein
MSATVSFMSRAVSPWPLPSLPEHMLQSRFHRFFARVSDAGVSFTGFSCRAASTGIAE